MTCDCQAGGRCSVSIGERGEFIHSARSLFHSLLDATATHDTVDRTRVRAVALNDENIVDRSIL